MPGDDVYELYIDAFTPATISMARLADYMRDFAEMLGNPEHVHFDKLKAGSLSLATRVDPVAQNKVAHRVEEIRYGGGPKPHSGPSNPWTTALPKTMRSGGWCIGERR